jgi:enoyl-CoA hydratase
MNENPYSEIDFEVHGDIAVIRFNRPEVMNCIGPVTHEELVRAWDTFKKRDDHKVAILTGAGERAFCAGGDLKAAYNDSWLASLSEEEIQAHRNGVQPGIIGPSRWTDIYKPIIAAINGVAFAGGLEWACFADIRVAEEQAKFGVTCRRWNIGLGDGGTQRLPRIVGLGHAMELILTGKVIDAQEAYRIGLVNEIVPRGSSLDRAMELAKFLTALPQPALQSDKEAVIKGLGVPLKEGLTIEANCFFDSIYSSQTRNALEGFIDRTHPDRIKGETSITPGLDTDG